MGGRISGLSQREPACKLLKKKILKVKSVDLHLSALPVVSSRMRPTYRTLFGASIEDLVCDRGDENGVGCTTAG